MHSRNPHMARAEVLIGQHRYDLAEPELRLALAEDPDEALAHAWLAMCLREREEFTPATDEARLAVGLAPDNAEVHYILSTIYHERHMPAEALRAGQEAIRLAPILAPYWGHLAFLHVNEKRYREGLRAAEEGLSFDAACPSCINARAMALRGLGRKDDAGDAVADALARNPESAIGHANMGWNLLHQSKPKEALVHFREALRLRPDLDWARAGIVEALKARWLPYRLMLRYFLFMSRMNRRTQWLIILGGFFAYQVARSIGGSNPTLAPYIRPVLWAYLGFAVSTWLSVPLFNLMLRVNRFGRMVLSRRETIAANLFGVSLLLPAGAAVVWAATRSENWMYAALYLLPQVVAVAMAGLVRRRRGLVIMWCWAGAVEVLTAALVVTILLFDRVPLLVFKMIEYGSVTLVLMGVGSVWLLNIVQSLPEKRRD